MFLVNGVSYLFSAVTEIFIRIPKIEHPSKRAKFFLDMKEGLRYVWQSTGLRFLMMAAGGLLGEIFPYKWIIFGAFAAIGIFIFPQPANQGVRDFFTMDSVVPAEGAEKGDDDLGT